MPAPSSVIRVPLTHPPFHGAATGNSYNVTLQISPSAPAPSPIHPCQVDTGSCGIVIPASLLYVNGSVGGTLLTGVTRGVPAPPIRYEPSNKEFQGWYYTVAELAIGASLARPPAFVAQNTTVVGIDDPDPGVGMMGVGFGRPTQYGSNVFLSAPGINPSFLLTTDGIWLGYTADTLPNAGDFGFQQLTPMLTGGWNTPAATVTIAQPGAALPPFPGNALLDTGVTLMMLGITQPLTPALLLGSTITISWPNTTNTATILSYSFQVTAPMNDVTAPGQYLVGGGSVMIPKSLTALPPKPAAFVNTGINVIRGADFFFDSATGCIGFLPTGAS